MASNQFNDEDCQRQAWELVHSKAWLSFLQPLLYHLINKTNYPVVNGLDSAFALARQQAEQDALKLLHNRITRLSSLHEIPKKQV